MLPKEPAAGFLFGEAHGKFSLHAIRASQTTHGPTAHALLLTKSEARATKEAPIIK